MSEQEMLSPNGNPASQYPCLNPIEIIENYVCTACTAHTHRAFQSPLPLGPCPSAPLKHLPWRTGAHCSSNPRARRNNQPHTHNWILAMGKQTLSPPSPISTNDHSKDHRLYTTLKLFSFASVSPSELRLEEILIHPEQSTG